MLTEKTKEKPKLLLLGFGDINQRLAMLRKDDTDITAVRRSLVSVDGIQCLAGDVTNRKFFSRLISQRPDQILITLSPSDHSEQGYMSTYLAAAETLVEAAEQINYQPEVIFVSSSSVYGQNQGELIDEESPCEPSRYNGQILLKAETCLLSANLPATIIRFSGIYGPGRYRLIKLSEAEPDTEPELIQWTNRIHADDCARAIAHLLDLPAAKRETVYLASDSEPVPSHSVRQWIKQHLAGNEPTLETCFDNNSRKEHKGKRCNNARLLKTGFEFKYPSYKQGFPEIIAQYLLQADRTDFERLTGVISEI